MKGWLTSKRFNPNETHFQLTLALASDCTCIKFFCIFLDRQRLLVENVLLFFSIACSKKRNPSEQLTDEKIFATSQTFARRPPQSPPPDLPFLLLFVFLHIIQKPSSSSSTPLGRKIFNKSHHVCVGVRASACVSVCVGVRVWACVCAWARVCVSMCVFVATEHLSSNRPYSLKQQPPDSTLSYGSELWASLAKQQLPRIMNFLDLKIILCQN